MNTAARVTEFIRSAELLYADVRRGDLSAEDMARLAAPTARLTQLLIPNSHQKISEVLYVSDHGFRVNPSQHGADMFDKANNPVELKVSVATQSNKWTCHFNWPVPGKGKSVEQRRKLLLESIDTKTKGGYAILIVRNGRGDELGHYKLEHWLLRGYFERIVIGGSDKHLLSCQQCRKCHKFHRMDKYVTSQQQGSEKIDWAKVMAATKSQC